MRRTPPLVVQAAYFARDVPIAARSRLLGMRGRVRDLSRGDRRPVVLLPGVFETWEFLRHAGSALHRLGHPLVTMPALRVNAFPIDASAAMVAAELERLDVRDAIVVAHSKGGLIGKQLMRRHDAEGRVAGLVTVATPFHGSSHARWIPVRPLHELRPGDPFLRELIADRSLDARIASIYPRFDPQIPDGSALDNGRDVEVPVVGHFRVLDDPRTIAAVLAAVEATPPGVAADDGPAAPADDAERTA